MKKFLMKFKKRKVKIFCAVMGVAMALTAVLYPIIGAQNTYAGASTSSYARQVQLLARAVNGEARGESYTGQVAVAAVILNRVSHPSFPKTIAGVIYQPGAFTAVSDGQINHPISSNSTVYKACQDAMNGWDPTHGAIYYYNPRTATNRWIRSRTIIKTIGRHVFCK